MFSSDALSSPLRLLSKDVTEDLFLWPELAAVAAVTPATGRRADDEAKGRVGGLLSPVPGFTCELVEALVLEEAADVAAGLRLVMVDIRFGGIPFFGGVFGTACKRLPWVPVVSLDLEVGFESAGGSLSSSLWAFSTASNGGRDSTGGPSILVYSQYEGIVPETNRYDSMDRVSKHTSSLIVDLELLKTYQGAD